MEFKDILTMQFERDVAYHNLWSMWFVVAFGLVGFAFTARQATSLLRVRVALIIGFAAFAIWNNQRMQVVDNQTIELTNMATAKAPSDADPLLATFRAPPPKPGWTSITINVTMWYHLIGDLLVGLFVFFAPRLVGQTSQQ